MFDLSRFLDMQDMDYETALGEIKTGRKMSHWMWYIFPQIKGLGMSPMAQRYAIESLEEAKEYMKNDVLRGRLIEISEAALSLETNNPVEVFGGIDAMKLRSSMTLFAEAAPETEVFKQVLDKYFSGEPDQKTLEILKK